MITPCWMEQFDFFKWNIFVGGFHHGSTKQMIGWMWLVIIIIFGSESQLFCHSLYRLSDYILLRLCAIPIQHTSLRLIIGHSLDYFHYNLDTITRRGSSALAGLHYLLFGTHFGLTEIINHSCCWTSWDWFTWVFWRGWSGYIISVGVFPHWKLWYWHLVYRCCMRGLLFFKSLEQLGEDIFTELLWIEFQPVQWYHRPTLGSNLFSAFFKVQI